MSSVTSASDPTTNTKRISISSYQCPGATYLSHLPLMANSEWSRVECPTSPYWLFTQSIVKSPNDDREYRLIRLENGLEAMLVHDRSADKAAASLEVAVGHLQDPVGSFSLMVGIIVLTFRQDDMPGLAHFCEHLLFMVRGLLRARIRIPNYPCLQGTTLYPHENDYSEVKPCSPIDKCSLQTCALVSQQKRWQCKRLHLLFFHDLSLRLCSICLPWCSRALRRVLPFAAIPSILHDARIESSRFRISQEQSCRWLARVSGRKDLECGRAPVEEIRKRE